MIRKLLWLILSIIVAIILFILLVAFFPSRKKTVNIINMKYVFVDSSGNEYDVFQKWHWAPEDRSFLFQKDYVGESEEDYNNKISNNETWDNELWHNLNPDNPFNLPEWAIEKPLPKDCETPRWVKIKDKESILAYEQRSDTPDICNVQRRTCNNWILDGSFTQPACNEKVTYTYNRSNNIDKEEGSTVTYTKKAVLSHNDVAKNELIQTPKYTKNEWAKYDKNWKLVKWSEEPTTVIGKNEEPTISDIDSVEQINKTYYNCKSPRWEIVQHWQFIRAYELPYWFTNASCNVELRLCVDWELKWSYTYKDCEYLDVTYEEYHGLSEDNQGLIHWEHWIAKEEKTWFWSRLKNLFN